MVIEMGRARWLAMMTMAAGVCAPCQAAQVSLHRIALYHCHQPSFVPEPQQRYRVSRHRLVNPSTPTEPARPHRTRPWLRGRDHQMPTWHVRLQGGRHVAGGTGLRDYRHERDQLVPEETTLLCSSHATETPQRYTTYHQPPSIASDPLQQWTQPLHVREGA